MATSSVTNVFTNSTTADAAEVNTNFSDLVSFLNNSVVHRDGSKALTAALPAGGFKITGLANGSAASDAAAFGQIPAKSIAFSIPGDTEAKTYAPRWYPGKAITLVNVMAGITTAPTGASAIFSLKISGTDAYPTSTNPTIAEAAYADTALRAPDNTAVGATAYVELVCEQVGSTVAGADAVVTVYYTEN